jgi:hypothetical protein
MNSPRIAFTLAGVTQFAIGFLKSDQYRRELQRRQTDNRHCRSDAVVICRITLHDRQRFAPALRVADVKVERGPFAIHALDEDHRGDVRFLHLHVTEVADRFIIEPPVGRSGVRRAAARPRRWILMTGIASIVCEATLQSFT